MPFVPVATVNDPDIAPPAIVQSGFEISPVTSDAIAQLVSLLLKFDPEMRTVVPGLPAAGSRLITGFSEKVAVALSFMGNPMALITRLAGPTSGTVNEPVMLPTPVTAHDDDANGYHAVGAGPLPYWSTQLVSIALKLVPVTVIAWPFVPKSLERVIAGIFTVKVSDTKPCATIVLLPSLTV